MSETEWQSISTDVEFDRHMRYRLQTPDWDKLTRNQRKKRKVMLKRLSSDVISYLDCCPKAIPAPQNLTATEVIARYAMPPVCKQNKEKEHAMRATLETTTSDTLYYIQNRLSSLKNAKWYDVEREYREKFPKNGKEAKEWFANGNFRLKTYGDEDFSSFELVFGKDAPNYEERDARWEKLEKSFQDAKDTVSIVSDEATRLKTLKEFEAYKA